ncbi:Eukaryotic translation initiation factor 5B [Vespula maculifrons]|uniref:Eukaryotic translation initiation factor 5B n=1 Tax=Vespula maculifrons TaxID=7453 RepID=A0ABD2AKV9_VESMC
MRSNRIRSSGHSVALSVGFGIHEQTYPSGHCPPIGCETSPIRAFVELGIVSSIEYNHKSVESARKGQEVCIKIEPIPGEAPKMFGRHFDEKDFVVSKVRVLVSISKLYLQTNELISLRLNF